MDEFIDNVISIHGERGKAWLNSLSELLTKCCRLWDLKIIGPFKNLSHNYVISVKSENSEAVIKLICDKQEFLQEIYSLKLLQKTNCIDLLNYSLELQAILLSKAKYSLENYFPDREDESISIYAEIIRELMDEEILELSGIPHVKKLLLSIKDNRMIFGDFTIKAHRYYEQLLLKNNYLLHGDLHQGNILKFNHSWVMIDPKCVIGPIEYEIAAFIINPKELLDENIHKIISARINRLSELLNINHVNLKKWVFIRTILAASWCLEDNISPNNFIKIASCVDLMIDK